MELDETMLLRIGCGAVAGLGVAVAGYAKAVSSGGEAFDPKKAGITVAVGILAGGVLASGFLDIDMVLYILSAAGLAQFEDVAKAVKNFWDSATGAKKKK